MSRLSRSILAALAVGAVAENSTLQPLQAPPIEVNAQIGRLHLPITCDLLGGLTTTFEVVTSGGTPAYAAPGADYYVTDIVGNITIPSKVLDVARGLNAVTVLANTTIHINATNASPSEAIAFSGVLPLKVPSKGSANLRFPEGNGTVAKIGPYTVGNGSEPSLTLIGNVEVSLDLLDAQGQSVTAPILINCPRQNIDYVLAAVSVDKTGTTDANYNPAPANGYVPDFKFVPLNHEYGFFRFPYNCVFGPLGPQSLDLTIGGQIPTFFNPGQVFGLTRATSFLRVPASLVKLAKEGFPTVKTFDTTVSEFDLLFSNTCPGSVNAASTPLYSSVDVTNVNTSDPLFIPIPEFTPLNLSTVTVDDKVGEFVTLSAGNATAFTALRDANGTTLFSFNVTCSPYAYLELIGIGITNEMPLNYTLGLAQN